MCYDDQELKKYLEYRRKLLEKNKGEYQGCPAVVWNNQTVTGKTAGEFVKENEMLISFLEELISFRDREALLSGQIERVEHDWSKFKGLINESVPRSFLRNPD